ncbi:hypothetical protein BDV37DRAFT_165863 [Aspergillus pseudonomiae]|uniref:Uncharacterized protein n=1 Tax=Aspergillus pseudonomiae TaxID=1506151 RepID=A0A5N7D7B2_9EURO|nr:uncharacterized protein BDV37DRAFT_165863 [Aspergillus pseudonomiae]KAE8402107.1 hypothetical protein BDV37DRAFT_165863 [Aspergillus pseudonomiae]
MCAMIGNMFVDLRSGLPVSRRRQDCRKLIDIRMGVHVPQHARLSGLIHRLLHSKRQGSAWSFIDFFSWW